MSKQQTEAQRLAGMLVTPDLDVTTRLEVRVDAAALLSRQEALIERQQELLEQALEALEYSMPYPASKEHLLSEASAAIRKYFGEPE